MIRESLNELRLKIKALAKRRQLDRDLEEELRFHLAMREKPCERLCYQRARQCARLTRSLKQ